MKPTKVKLGFSTLMGSNISKDIKLAKSLKCDTLSLDLSKYPNLKFSEYERRSLKSFGKDYTLILHLPYYLPTNTKVDLIFSSVINYFKKIINFAIEVNAKTITFHAGYVEGFKTDLTSLASRINALSNLMKGTKLSLSIENDDKCNDYPLWDEKMIIKILQMCPQVSYTLDVGHANTANINILKHIEKVHTRIDVVHLHNNHGRDQHLSLNTGDIKMKEIIKKLMTRKNILFILENISEKDVIISKNFFESIIKNE